MNLADFGALLAHSPHLFSKLLRLSGVGDSDALKSQIIQFFRLLTAEDVAAHHQHQTLAPRRLARLSRRAALDVRNAYLPLSLYRLYKEELEAARRSPSGRNPSTEEIIFWLTGGELPIDYCFLVGAKFCVWNAEAGELLIGAISDGDSDLQRASAAYLAAVGSAFRDLDEVYDEVKRRGLPNSGSVRRKA